MNEETNTQTSGVVPDVQAPKMPTTVPEPPLTTPPTLTSNNSLPQPPSPLYGSLNKFWSESRAYLVEYALLLIALGTLLGTANSMFGGIIDYLGQVPKASWWSSGTWAYTASLSMLATIVVFIPTFFLLTKRTEGSEGVNPEIKSLRWRKGFLGIFLILTTIVALGYGVAFFYTIFSKIASVGLPNDGTATVWRSITKDLFAFVLFALTVWLYSRDYGLQKDKPKFWARLHRYSVVVVVAALAFIFCLVPLRKQRNTFIDQIITDDVQSIHSKVEGFASKNDELPKDLEDLNLDQETKAHADSYNYEYSKKSDTSYEICAEFTTDTSNQKEDVNPLERYSGVAYSSDSNTSPNPDIHKKGRDCFEYKSTVSSSNEKTIYDNLYDSTVKQN